jgi:hypothetical protein
VTPTTITTAAQFAAIKQRAAAELRAIAEETRALRHRWANAASVLAYAADGCAVEASTVGYSLGAAASELRALAERLEKP